MKQLTVSLPEGRSYDITISRGILARCGEEIRKVFSGSQVAVITDSNVGPLYAKTVLDSLKSAGYAVKSLSFPAGESSKNMETLVQLYDGLLTPYPFPMTRGGLIVALGGGVTGDMAGFAAATLLRGIPFVQIPTTLLAQVDSSVGGKVAVDLKQGKNLAGAFYQPKAVLIDPDTLDTLPDRIFFDGMAEVVKYGLIGDRELLERLEGCAGREELCACMEEILFRSCDQKRRVVEADEQDTGGRMVLNFGHTLGHVYEKLGHYSRYMHGEAVSCGMVSILRMGEAHGLTAPGTTDRAERLLSRWGLPVQAAEVPAELLRETLAYDKKGSGGEITAVFCKQPGEAFLQKMSRAEFAAWAEELA
ncbi:MAG: 3-dehydroquinate synthase [Candidatus Merdivicinus sp.]|jgi:3-dehydroquinate synthase